MEKKQSFSIYPVIIMGVFLVIASSCKKDDEKEIPLLSTSDVTKILQITAESGGIITSDGGFVVTARGVCWSTRGNPTIADNKTSDGPGAGSFTSKLTGLTADTTYYVRAYATNSKGTGYGSTMVFQTMGNTFTDSRDGNVYKIITIGDQLWMAENLRYLPSVVGPANGSQTTPRYYVYGYNGTNVANAKTADNYNTYGVLYNWPAATEACPTGWHLPSDAEWTQLADYLGGTSVAGGKLKATIHWNSPNTGATNETGFTALPGGFRLDNGTFVYIGNQGVWWSATEYLTDYARCQYMYHHNSVVYRFHNTKPAGLSVRCVRD